MISIKAMWSSQTYGVMALIIVALIIVSAWYFERLAEQEAIALTVKDGRLTGSDTSDDPHSILEYPIFDTGTLVAAHHLFNNEALVVYGEIPRGHIYWALTGYLYDRPGQLLRTSLGDSVSHGDTIALSPGDGVAVVVTANPLLFDLVRADLLKYWPTIALQHPLKVVPIYIPRHQYYRDARYTIQARVERHGGDALPPKLNPWQTRRYYATNLPVRWVDKVDLIARNDYPREQHSVSETTWLQTAREQISIGYTITRQIPIHPGPSGAMTTPPDCGFDNRDITAFASQPFTLNPGEYVVVVAADHVASDRCQYSNVAFTTSDTGVFARCVTGDPSNRTRNTNATIRAAIIAIQPGAAPQGVMFRQVAPDAQIQVIERAFVERRSKVGPAPTSILPMIVFTAIPRSPIP